MHPAVLFDLDGTLTDSGEGIINCTIPVLEYYGLPVPCRQDLRFLVGPPLDQSFVQLGVPENQVQNAIEIYRRRYTTVGKFENFPYPGIPELLETLQSDGFRLFIATSKPESLAVEILEHFQLSRYFVQICGATMDGSRSHKSDVISYLLEQHRDLEQITMVGDTVFDILGAAALHIPAIGVAWGYGSVAQMQHSGAIAIVNTPEELYTALNRQKDR